MKKVLIVMALLLSVIGLKAQSISHIETTKNWYYIYDQDGKKIKTLSTSQGELKGSVRSISLSRGLRSISPTT